MRGCFKMEDKYIDLLLQKCTDFKNSNILFIHYSTEVKSFIEKLIEKAKDLGFKDFYLDEENIYDTHEILANSTIEEIKNNSYFDESIWDEYAKKNACFLIFETEYPHLMDDMSSEKISISSRKKRESRPIYRKMVENCELSWCIAAYPGEQWAKEVFIDEENAYQKLEQTIYQICMINQDNPIESWEKHLNKTGKMIDTLNKLQLTKLHYENRLGTNLDVYLPEDYLFASAKDGSVIVNMPSYEVFASPIYNKTEGIVYSSMPLIYNGAIIDKFWLKFEDGKVIDFDAKVGKDVLKEIIEIDDNSCYLGECALVEKSSPIASMNMVFGTTLIDENPSCHLALGAGFPECIKDGLGIEEKELLEKGINVSKGHVDFMIGTADLNITGTTINGEEIFIFKDGNFNSELIK